MALSLGCNHLGDCGLDRDPGLGTKDGRRKRRRRASASSRGVSYAYSQHRLRFYIWLGSSVWVLFGTFSALEPLFYRDILQVEPRPWGWVNSIFGLGLIGGTWIASRLPPRYRTARSLVLIVALTPWGCLPTSGPINCGVVVAGVFWGVITGSWLRSSRTLIQLNTPEALMGRITGVTQVHFEVGHCCPSPSPRSWPGFLASNELSDLSGLALAVFALFFVPTANCPIAPVPSRSRPQAPRPQR